MNELENRRDSEYRIQSVGVGTIVCSRPGVSLVDFYRTSGRLACEVEDKPLTSETGSKVAVPSTDDKDK